MGREISCASWTMPSRASPGIRRRAEAEASIRDALGQSYIYLGEPEAGRPVQRSLELKRAVLGPEAHEMIVAISGVAESHYNAGRLDKAIPLFEVVLRLMDKVLGGDTPARDGRPEQPGRHVRQRRPQCGGHRDARAGVRADKGEVRTGPPADARQHEQPGQRVPDARGGSPTPSRLTRRWSSACRPPSIRTTPACPTPWPTWRWTTTRRPGPMTRSRSSGTCSVRGGQPRPRSPQGNRRRPRPTWCRSIGMRAGPTRRSARGVLGDCAGQACRRESADAVDPCATWPCGTSPPGTPGRPGPDPRGAGEAWEGEEGNPRTSTRWPTRTTWSGHISTSVAEAETAGANASRSWPASSPITGSGFHTMSQLGAVLAGQKRYAVAEPLLDSAGYARGSSPARVKIPPPSRKNLADAAADRAGLRGLGPGPQGGRLAEMPGPPRRDGAEAKPLIPPRWSPIRRTVSPTRRACRSTAATWAPPAMTRPSSSRRTGKGISR